MNTYVDIIKLIKPLGGDVKMDNKNPFEPVRIRSLLASDQIYLHIKEAIISGELTSEERLIETQLAKWLQVSRTPLREALQRLESEKWLARIQGGGLKVVEFDLEDMKHLYQVRAILEGLLAREVTLKLTGEELETIKSLTNEMFNRLHAKETKEFVAAADKIHHLMNNKSTNTIAKDLLININDHIKYCRNQVIRWVPDFQIGAYEEHVELLNALIKRDPIEVEKVMRRHFENAGDRLLKSLDQSGKQCDVE